MNEAPSPGVGIASQVQAIADDLAQNIQAKAPAFRKKLADSQLAVVPSEKPNRDQRRLLAISHAQTAATMRAKGASLDEIATALEISKGGAWKAVQRAIRHLSSNYRDREHVEGLRAIELERLEIMSRALLDQIECKDLAPEIRQGACNCMVKLQARRAAYLGLDSLKGQTEGEKQAQQKAQMEAALEICFANSTEEEALAIQSILATIIKRTRQSQLAGKIRDLQAEVDYDEKKAIPATQGNGGAVGSDSSALVGGCGARVS
jgi:hypothetical protein